MWTALLGTPPANPGAARTGQATDEAEGGVPEVRVSIGRIDVRAAAPPVAAAPPRRGPRLTLQEYLRRTREQGRR